MRTLFIILGCVVGLYFVVALWFAVEMMLHYAGKKNLPLRRLFMRFAEWAEK